MARILQRHYGGSAQFSTVSSSAVASTVASTLLSPGSGSFTIRSWYKAVSFVGSTKVFARYTGATYNVDGWMISQHSQNAFIYTKSGSPAVTVPNIFDTGWHLYCFVFDASDHSISSYRDGVFIVKSSINAWSGSFNASESLYIGGYLGGATGANITDVIYDVGTAWTATQVSDDYFHNIQPSTITNRWLLNEGAGNTATALVGGLNMTLSGGANFSGESPMILNQKQRHYGGSILNNNSAPSVSIADHASLKPAGSLLTVECWIKPELKKLNEYQMIVGKMADATWSNGGFALHVDQHGSLKFFINHYVTGGTYTGNGKLKNWVWQHIVGVYNGIDLRIYINGVLSNTPTAYTTEINYTTGYVGIGMHFGSQHHDSNIAEARLYSRALSATEIMDRYQFGTDDAAMRVGLYGEWNFEDVARTSCVDRSGNSNTATLASASMASTDSPMIARGAVVNHVPYSESLNVLAWAQDAVSVDTYSGSIPSGLTEAKTITDTNVSTVHRVRYSNVPLITGQEYIASCYAKKVSGANSWIAMGPNAGAIVSYYNLSTGAIGSSGGAIGTTNIISRNIENVGNDFYRISMAFRADTTLANALVFNIYMASADGTVTYANGGTANIYVVSGVQIEKSTYGQTTPSTYVATNEDPLSMYGFKDNEQNLATNSENIAAWSNLSIGLNGVLTADTDPYGATVSIIDDYGKAAGLHAKWIPSPAYVPTSIYTATFTAKYVSGSGYILVGASDTWAVFDVKNGVVGNIDTGRALSSSIRPLGSGWYECTTTYRIDRIGLYFRIGAVNNITGTINSNGDWSMGIGRISIIQSNVPGQYVKTTTAALNIATPRNIINSLQNLLLYSEQPTSWSYAWAGVSGSNNSTEVSPPSPEMSVGKIIYNGLGTSGDYRFAIPSGVAIMANNVNYTGSLWIRTDAGSRALKLNLNGFGNTDFTATTTWQRVSVTTTGNGISSLYLDLKDRTELNSAFTVYVTGAHVVQSDHPGEYVKTTASILNIASPRKLA